jgi:O-acetyl-ADP-ribose deacetylase (regulator of RNase III)
MIEIDVWQGDIAELEVDALIVPANESLFMTAPVAASVKRHGGDEIEAAAVASGPIAPGTAIVTHGGRLAAPYVIHAVAVGHDLRADPERLRGAITTALGFCQPLQLRRLAIASLGTERGVFTADESAAILVDAVDRIGREAPLPESVVFATGTVAELRAFASAVERARVEAR